MPAYAISASGERRCILDGHTTSALSAPGDDGLQVDGRKWDAVEVEDHVFDFRSVPTEMQDEVLSGVCAANVTMRRCLILGGIKAILAGNGDHPLEDYGRARWHLEDCAIVYSGRRCPEAQDGTLVTMRRCWVHDWGQTFDVRAFGAWAHRGGKILAEDCLFTQSGSLFGLGMWRSLLDLCRHLGQVVNDGTIADLLRWRAWMPGICRGLTADTGGFVLANRCWANRWWIRLENADNTITRKDARALAYDIITALSAESEDVALQALALFAIRDQL